MSRTYRNVGRDWSFKHNSFQDARNTFLYGRYWKSGADQSVDLFFNPDGQDYERDYVVEDDYQDRTRHTSLSYPHYSSAYDDNPP